MKFYPEIKSDPAHTHTRLRFLTLEVLFSRLCLLYAANYSSQLAGGILACWSFKKQKQEKEEKR